MSAADSKEPQPRGDLPPAPDWHTLDPAAVLTHLETDPNAGLAPREAAERLATHGPNELEEQAGRGPLRIIWEQLTSTMVLILVVAAVVSALIGDYKDAAAIAAIVVLFAFLGFIQEYRAERAMSALKRMAVPSVRVIRAGSTGEIAARDLVPGDILLLEAGNVVPADGRLLMSADLRVHEAALTGESEAVEKVIQALAQRDLVVGDRRNMVYMGTTVTHGRGTAVVTATGMRTELGAVAGLLGGVKDEATPLQRRLDRLGLGLALVGVLVAGVVFLAGLAIDEPLEEMLLTAVSVAVAIVPEGLPAVLTITLALGAQRMLRRQALIRRLPAVETLGSVTTICSDKTGTLTENRMTVVVLDIAGDRLDLDETMRRSSPSLEIDRSRPGLLEDRPPALSILLAGAALCNDAILVQDEDADHVRALGDPTEGALLIAAAHAGLFKDELASQLPRVAEVPFDSERKRMSTVHTFARAEGPGASSVLEKLARVLPSPADGRGVAPSDGYVVITKGAVDGLLEHSNLALVGDRVEPLTPEIRDRVHKANDSMAAQGLRVLGVSIRPLAETVDQPRAETIERDLVFVGLIGMIDPPRPEVKEAVALCRAAGIRPVMITGDHPLTAVEIARQLGITDDTGRVLTGRELEALPPDALAGLVEDVPVYARVSPEHKLRIVEALQARGHVVAMTGDGVNDAPALKKADIGVAMGITGTDVAKEAAAMVLQDDNFATIVAAVEEGRTIYDNLRKFLKFSIAGNIGKVSVMLLAPILGNPLPLAPLQLLWLNLLTDGLLGLGLGVEQPEAGTMRRPPYSPKEGILARGLGWHIAGTGLLIAALAGGIGYLYWQSGQENWQTVVFTALAFCQVGQAFGARSSRESLWSQGLLSNRPLALLAVLVVALQVAVVYLPFLQRAFDTLPLSAADIAVCAGLGLVVLVAMELEKVVTRRREIGKAMA